MSVEQPEEVDPTIGALQAYVSALALEAARVRLAKPLAELVGLIAESGTVECNRARALVAQQTGEKATTEGFAGILPTASLPQILAQTFPAEAIEWIREHDKDRDILQILVCTSTAVRVAAVAIPELPPE